MLEEKIECFISGSSIVSGIFLISTSGSIVLSIVLIITGIILGINGFFTK